MNAVPNSMALLSGRLTGPPNSTFRSRAIGALKRLAGGSSSTDSLEQREARAVARHQLGKRAPDAALAERALVRWEEEELDRQFNRETIAEQAANLLQDADENAQEPSLDPELDPDWLNVFASFAEKASGASLQQIWARVLAGEIKKPGAVSLRTLQFASTLDRATAEAVQTMASWVYNGKNMPHMAAEHIPFETVHLLKGVGLIGSMDSDVQTNVTFDDGYWGANFDDIAVLLKGQAGHVLNIPGMSVSRIARELLTTITLSRDPAAPIAFAEWCKSQGVVQEILVGPCVKTPNGLSQPTATLISKWVRPTPDMPGV